MDEVAARPARPQRRGRAHAARYHTAPDRPADDTVDVVLGQTLGSYTIERELGRGGMGDLSLIDHCECWGTNLACFQSGSRWAVVLDSACDFAFSRAIGEAPVAEDVVVGKTIIDVVWTPRPLVAKPRR